MQCGTMPRERSREKREWEPCLSSVLTTGWGTHASGSWVQGEGPPACLPEGDWRGGKLASGWQPGPRIWSTAWVRVLDGHFLVASQLGSATSILCDLEQGT